MKLNNKISLNNTKNKVYASHHYSKINSDILNKAIEKIIQDKEFVDSSLELLNNIKFPVSRSKIIDHVKRLTNDEIIIALFFTLSDSVEYKDVKQLKNIFQGNIPAKNSPSRTKTPDKLNVNPITAKNRSSYSNNNSNSSSSMRDYICNKCGKPFLTREDLKIHKKFEGK